MRYRVEGKTSSTTPACGVIRFRKLTGLAIFKSLLMGLACLFAQSSNVSAQRLTASDGAAFDYFGYAVSLSGNTAIVGAFSDSDKGLSSGSAYVFRDLDTATGSVTESVKLTASDGAPDDGFGWSVSQFGNTAIVGVFGNYDDGSFSGSAYVFRDLDTATGSITESVKLTASDGAPYDRFGGAVSHSGNTAVVGAQCDDCNGSDSGAAYVFRDLDTATGSITESVKLIASDGETNDEFGKFVSHLGNRAIVGANGNSSVRNGSFYGSAYVFRDLDTATGTITESVKLIASNGATDDRFGWSVSQSGNTAIVGANGDDDNGAASGSAYVFRDLHTATGSITESVKLTASDGAREDYFSYSVSQSGNTAIVGASGDDDNGSNSGSAYVFRDLHTATGSITESFKLTASDGAQSDRFGVPSSLDGDRFLVGASRSAGVVVDSGSAYTGTVSSMTTLDFGDHSSIIESISFESRTDWIIGENTSSNRLLLSENDTARVLSSGRAVHIGDNAGSNDNRLTIAGTIYTNEVYVGDQDNSDNLLVFEDSASHFIHGIYVAEGNSLCIEGDYTSYSLLDSYFFFTDLFIVRDGMSELVTSSNFDTLLATNFDSTTGFTHVTVKPILLGNLNLDGVVNLLDIAPFIAILSNAGFQAEADCNEDGLVTFLDIASFIAILSGTNDN